MLAPLPTQLWVSLTQQQVTEVYGVTQGKISIQPYRGTSRSCPMAALEREACQKQPTRLEPAPRQPHFFKILFKKRKTALWLSAGSILGSPPPRTTDSCAESSPRDQLLPLQQHSLWGHSHYEYQFR